MVAALFEQEPEFVCAVGFDEFVGILAALHS